MVAIGYRLLCALPTTLEVAGHPWRIHDLDHATTRFIRTLSSVTKPAITSPWVWYSHGALTRLSKSSPWTGASKRRIDKTAHDRVLRCFPVKVGP